MTYLRGVVVDIQKDTVMVITPDYDLITVEKNGQTFEVGEEIAFYKQLVPKPFYRKWNRVIAYGSGIAAILLLCFVGVIPGLNSGGRVEIAKQQKPLPRSVRFPNHPVATTHTQPIINRIKPDKKPESYRTHSKMDPPIKEIPPENDIPSASDHTDNKPTMKEAPKPKKPIRSPKPKKEKAAPTHIKEVPLPGKETPIPSPGQKDIGPAKEKPFIDIAVSTHVSIR